MMCYTADYEGELKPASETEAMNWLGCEDWACVSPAVQIIFGRLKELQRLS